MKFGASGNAANATQRPMAGRRKAAKSELAALVRHRGLLSLGARYDVKSRFEAAGNQNSWKPTSTDSNVR
jgi:hypothetical protein